MTYVRYVDFLTIDTSIKRRSFQCFGLRAMATIALLIIGIIPKIDNLFTIIHSFQPVEF